MASVMVVDDHDDTVLLYCRILAAAGFEVHGTASANEALNLALEQHPDLVVLDLAMPEMDGHELARLLRSYRATRDIRLVAVSAHAFDFESVLLPPGGWDACLHKPCDPVDLVSIVRLVLAAGPGQRTMSGPVVIAPTGPHANGAHD